MPSESTGNFWGSSLIRHDKSASPLLEQLCLGIARVIATLEPTATDLLIPSKLATFYRSVGGNYDPLFMATSNAGISLVYRSLGCFHSLQPSVNPFEKPSIPALLPSGFVRWQTIQLLLNPDENVPYLQEALKRFDVLNPSTGLPFPKHLPRGAFAEYPDKDMTAWHDEVSRRLQQEGQNVNYQSSPMHSPRRGREHYPDYFAANGFNSRRSSRHSRANSRDQVMEYPNDRRGSLPERHNSYNCNGDLKHNMTSVSMGDMRYPHGVRTSILQGRESSGSRHRHSSSSTHRHSSATLRHRPSSSGQRPEPYVFDTSQVPAQRRQRSSTTTSSPGPKFRPLSPSSAENTPSSGSDASSETSSPNHIPEKRRSSLFPPSSFFRQHHRRHSADPPPSYDTKHSPEEVCPPLPPRPSKSTSKQYEYPSVPPSSYSYVPGPTLRHRDPLRSTSSVPGANFRDVKPREPSGLFDNVPWDNTNPFPGSKGTTTAESSPTSASYPPIPKVRYFDPKGQPSVINSASNGKHSPTSRFPALYTNHTDNNNGNVSGDRKSGISGGLGRSRTVAGSGGRHYGSSKPAGPVPCMPPHISGAATGPATATAGGNGTSIPKAAWD